MSIPWHSYTKIGGNFGDLLLVEALFGIFYIILNMPFKRRLCANLSNYFKIIMLGYKIKFSKQY